MTTTPSQPGLYALASAQYNHAGRRYVAALQFPARRCAIDCSLISENPLFYISCDAAKKDLPNATEDPHEHTTPT